MTYSVEYKITDIDAEIEKFLDRVPYVIHDNGTYAGILDALEDATVLLRHVKEERRKVNTSPEKKFKVKNIDRPDWREHPFMVIRDCRYEKTHDDGYWYWGSYDELITAYIEATELCNGLLVSTKEVEEIK